MDNISMYLFALFKFLLPAIILFFVIKKAIKHALKDYDKDKSK